ncbi:hypothetical cytosolic protein [Syntrophus aciditrophicus SB]|uniref:Hypothetical cytosolic protein n=1 Tax=Syntrophus aciditrophicus (strain SB) TaxID=56780 RepID=Q2LPJ2_SYNAS|nr:hypothetical cytosolic protein [Syntrophus aciditrophicus SB]
MISGLYSESLIIHESLRESLTIPPHDRISHLNFSSAGKGMAYLKFGVLLRKLIKTRFHPVT